MSEGYGDQVWYEPIKEYARRIYCTIDRHDSDCGQSGLSMSLRTDMILLSMINNCNKVGDGAIANLDLCRDAISTCGGITYNYLNA